MDKSIIFDTLIFFITNIYLIFFSLKQKGKLIKKIFVFILLLSINSAFNIMVKSVHDFNLLIPRTFIWTFKFGPFSIYDIIFVLLFIYSLTKLNYKLFNNKVIRIIYLRDGLILIISIISYIIFKGYWLDGGTVFFRNLKGILYFNATLFLTVYYVNNKIELKKYVIPIFVILISGMVSIYNFPLYDVWIRYGQRVKILSQEAANTISLFIITYLVIYFFIKKKFCIMDFIWGLILLILMLQNILSMYKTSILYLAFVIILLPLLKLSKKKFILWYFCVTLVVILGIGLSNTISNMAYSQSVKTRNVQTADYLNYIKNKSPLAYILGTGLGTPYRSSSTDDPGEVKIIDRQQQAISGYKFEFQVPVVSVFKVAGTTGLTIFILSNIWLIYLLIKNCYISLAKLESLTDKTELLTICFLISFFSWWEFFMIDGLSPNSIFEGFIVGRLVVLLKDKNGDIKHTNLYKN